MPGQSFDRVADHYDASRGGLRRGRQIAEVIEPWIVGDRVVELGIGTGVVAAALEELGHHVVGVDLSADMMRAAVDRLGARVARADVDTLPLADDSIDTAVFVWVLQLVDDITATLSEAARVVRPGGRVVVVSADGDSHPDDEIGTIADGLRSLKQPGRHADTVAALAPDSLALEYRGVTPWLAFEGSVAHQIELIERRSYSSLWHLGDDDWQQHVVPVLDRLRALPDPERMRPRHNRQPVLVWHVPRRA